jgi:hypothetical protein
LDKLFDQIVSVKLIAIAQERNCGGRDRCHESLKPILGFSGAFLRTGIDNNYLCTKRAIDD